SNKQEIFHDDEDNSKFIDVLKKYKSISEIKLYGWCLMNNHIHILLEQGKEDLAVTMKRIGVSYAYYYNNKYATTGHLFQDRYLSENVEDETYLLTVLRYIHQNPVKAGMVKNAEDWKWSSCQSYYEIKSSSTTMLDSKFILGIFSNNMETAIKSLKDYNQSNSDIECLDYTPKEKFSDNDVKEMLLKIVTLTELANIKGMPKAERDSMIRRLKENGKVSNRQLARILGISEILVRRA
ncbi:MAG TPA: transposase, partial [Clostridia bacterium]|nr:transposase [Clostridia bacterium]